MPGLLILSPDESVAVASPITTKPVCVSRSTNPLTVTEFVPVTLRRSRYVSCAVSVSDSVIEASVFTKDDPRCRPTMALLRLLSM